MPSSIERRFQKRLQKLEHEQAQRQAEVTAHLMACVHAWEDEHGPITRTADDQTLLKNFLKKGSYTSDTDAQFFDPLSDRECLGLVKGLLIFSGDLSEEVADAN